MYSKDICIYRTSPSLKASPLTFGRLPELALASARGQAPKGRGRRKSKRIEIRNLKI
jgi:hypothetical protein